MFALLRLIGLFFAVILSPVVSFAVYVAAIIAGEDVVYTDPLAIFAYSAEFVGFLFLFLTVVPFSGIGILLVIIIFEATKLRSFIVYALLGAGFAWLTLGWTVALWNPEWQSSDFPSVAAGIAGGLTYWVFAGRLSGRWDWAQTQSAPQYRNEGP